MNFLAKHFFDYQSFINLPHTAVQMHKMPPSQAGCDPSAAWAPKDLHVAGKNHAAPAARANRGYHGGDQRTGSHRHGRPSKLEFRNWGERHGELRSEKIVPHTENWLEKEKDFSGRINKNNNFGGISFAATAIIGPSHSPLDNFKQKLFLFEQFIGGYCLIGPSGSISRGNIHWKQMIKKINTPIYMWHELIPYQKQNLLEYKNNKLKEIEIKNN
uniref:Uncharacterized protein n=1 Tax=Meloidogyne hapla TaxID=6305 RepID=A0A1I8B6S9_MELHA